MVLQLLIICKFVCNNKHRQVVLNSVTCTFILRVTGVLAQVKRNTYFTRANNVIGTQYDRGIQISILSKEFVNHDFKIPMSSHFDDNILY